MNILKIFFISVHIALYSSPLQGKLARGKLLWVYCLLKYLVRLSLASSKFKDNLTDVFAEGSTTISLCYEWDYKANGSRFTCKFYFFTFVFTDCVYFSRAKHSTLFGGNAPLMGGISSQIHFIHSSYTFIKWYFWRQFRSKTHTLALTATFFLTNGISQRLLFSKNSCILLVL